MSPERLAEHKLGRHEAYLKRKARDPEGFKARAREATNRRRAAAPERYAKDPERYRGYAKAFAERNPEAMRDKQYQRYYGVTLEEYQRMWDAQGGLCAICQRPETMTNRGKLKELSVDHDHDTGMVRALLCSACNRALGFFNEDVGRIEAALAYLRSHSDG